MSIKGGIIMAVEISIGLLSGANMVELSKIKTARNKGKSLILFPENYIVIDIETTGLDAKYDEIIEVSALKVQNGKIVDRFSSLVRPDYFFEFDEELDDDYSESFKNDLIVFDEVKGFYISEFIKDLTGITNKMVEHAPLITEVLHEFKKFIGADSILVGHNVNFDINFLYDNFSTVNHVLENDFVDTLRISRRLLPEIKNHKLKTLAEYFNISCDNMHRGEEDCIITLNILKELEQIAIDKFQNKDSFYESIKSQAHSRSDYDMAKSLNLPEFIDETSIFYNKECVFTGKLDKMIRKAAMQLVVDLGGSCGGNVTKKTNYLILGNNDYCSTIKDGKSGKQKKAEKLKLEGQDIEIITETVFYDMIEN